MLEKSSEMEKQIRKNTEIEQVEEKDSQLRLIDNVVRDFAPEIAYSCQFREDEAEEQQIKTGRLHENRILGIFLKFYLEGIYRITTAEVEEEYKRYFKDVARSTISTYLNMLKKESSFHTKRIGRLVYYSFFDNPPQGISPFWLTRIFCTVPAYFNRAMYFSILYINASQYIQKYLSEDNFEDSAIDRDVMIRNFKFFIGLIILNIFKIRSSKCVSCQFSRKEVYMKLERIIDQAIKDRTDVLPEEILDNLIQKCSELSLFDGVDIKDNDAKEKLVKELMKSAKINKKDLEFQIMVSDRRQNLRLDQTKTLEKEQLSSVLLEEKSIRDEEILVK